MDLNWAVMRLGDSAEAIRQLVAGVGPEQARWQPDPDSWSVLEVVCHLHDEEREDFRVRLAHILAGKTENWPPIDPGGWVTARAYNQQDLAENLTAFLAQRRASVAWLASLDDPDWGAHYPAPWGAMRAGDILAAWVAHDLLHTRQLVELLYAYTVQESAPYDVRYAGEW